MAFQDSTYGIVLDAVLTDAGRKRMANGNFSISKFNSLCVIHELASRNRIQMIKRKAIAKYDNA